MAGDERLDRVLLSQTSVNALQRVTDARDRGIRHPFDHRPEGEVGNTALSPPSAIIVHHLSCSLEHCLRLGGTVRDPHTTVFNRLSLNCAHTQEHSRLPQFLVSINNLYSQLP